MVCASVICSKGLSEFLKHLLQSGGGVGVQSREASAMSESFEMSAFFPGITAERVYRA